MCPPARRTILVVEDDFDTVQFYEVLLQMEGYVTLAAPSRQQARALVATRPIDDVLLDYRLLDIRGFDLCPELRAALGSGVPLLLLTAEHEAGLEAKAFVAGATVFLPKPFEPDVLLTLLNAYVPSASCFHDASTGQPQAKGASGLGHEPDAGCEAAGQTQPSGTPFTKACQVPGRGCA